MARRDVLIYYTQVENQYLEMLADIKDYEAAHKSGEITDEKYNELTNMIEALKANYERLSYIMFLLNAPARDSKKAKYYKQNKKVVGALTNSSEEKIINENADILKNLKQLLKGE